MNKSLLLCIAFYYTPEKKNRCWYVHQMIVNINTKYEYNTHIIIDTNNDEVVDLFNCYSNVEVVVHKTLEHPFHLVWMHRKHISERINQYDIVMYTEDDIIVPFKSILDFMEKIEYMWPKYIPCFERLEWSFSKKCFVALDVYKKETVKKGEIVTLNGKRFFTPKFPYHGFWILPTKYLRDIISRNFIYLSVHREYSSSYPLGPPTLNFAHDPSRGECYMFLNKIPLFELDEDDKINNNCLVYHISNSYNEDKDNHFGKIPIEEMVEIIE